LGHSLLSLDHKMRHMPIIYTHPILPPGLLVLGGKKYITSTWQEVPLNTQPEDIKWIKPEIIKDKEEVFEFKSKSDPTITYVTKKITNSKGEVKFSCNCPGVWRSKDRKCKHIKSI
jgi:desulfoferrodoxin (superoxide reductase-like protein)